MSTSWRDVALPPEMAQLPRDARGFPVLFTAYVDAQGQPNFRVSDDVKRMRCLLFRLCGVCGKPLGYWIYFIGGPLCLDNGVFGDAPMHEACMRYAVAVCPYLSIRSMEYDKQLMEAGERGEGSLTIDPTAVREKPAEMILYKTNHFKAVRNGASFVFQAPRPVSYEVVKIGE